MIPSFLITLREVIEASLIVATILGILMKFGHLKDIKIVWLATTLAACASFALVGFGSLGGISIQKYYTGLIEQTTEGTLMILSALFITWAVFFLHKYFSPYKVRLLTKLRPVVGQKEKRGLFALVFTAVFREGFEIALFLTTIYLSSKPIPIISGFGLGIIFGVLISWAFFSATIKLPVYWAFRVSSLLLILFAGGLVARGAQEFIEAGILPQTGGVTLVFIPQSSTLVGNITTAIFGLTRSMDLLQISLYLIYIWVMHWWVFVRQPGINKKTF